MSLLYSIFITIIVSLILIAALFIDGFLSPPVFSFSAPSTSSTIKENISWHISALKVSYDNKNQIYVAEGDVVITGKTARLKAEYVEFSNITRDAVASGNVLLTSGRDSVTCDRLKLNLETEIGTIYNGVVFIEENHFYITGDTIEKTGKDTYRAGKASVTSCDGANPDWKLSGENIHVTIDGYGTAKSATLWAGKIPALYSPVLLFPAKTTRQTGLLTPQISSSDKKGFQVEQPLFLALSRGSDATVYTDYMSKRGMKTSLEYRYLLSSNGSDDGSNFGTFFYDYLNDENVDQILSESVNYNFDSTPARTSHDRYWFRMKNNHTFDNVWHTRLDIDYVSDSNYLRDFKDGFTGFDSVSRYFSKTFGRTIDEYDDSTRENSLNINRTWRGAALNIGAQWFDNVAARENSGNEYASSKDTTLQKLPSIEFNTVKQQVGKTPFYCDFDSEYRYFYRQDTSGYLYRHNSGESFNSTLFSAEPLLKGHRTDIFPRVYMPVKLGPFYMEPSAGFRQTLWYADNSDNGMKNGGTATLNMENTPTAISQLTQDQISNLNHREMVDLNLELSTKLSRVFNIGDKVADNNNIGSKNSDNKINNTKDKFYPKVDENKAVEKIKHEIIPKIEYSFIPGVNQDRLPYFDELDYIDERNFITWSLGNRLTSRNKKRGYNEFAWVEICQSYRINTTEPERLLNADTILNSDAMSDYDQPFYSGKLLNSDTLTDLSRLLNTDEPSFQEGRSFSDVSAKIEFSPSSLFSINSNVKWSPYDNRFSSHDSGMTIRDTRGDALEVWYRYERYQSDYPLFESLISSSESLTYNFDSLPSESFFASLNTKITDAINIFFICEHSLAENKNIESHTGFYLDRPCWSMRLSYSENTEDRSLSLIVNLRGVGEFGKK